ncbi:hypothetical protein SteCoe_23935 [Stentor coeruleus]|uniref:PH domain-containing protein n=1 Tax=Stentor coeruleus TaxID=5963 RepID=A0A1R2BIQ8_9CILI|nr:hypothetical protein SteCoe_23935 [Stentor coeruleus]
MNNPVAWCLAYLFNKYFSGFIKELSTEQIIVSLLKGDIKLGDLEIASKEIKSSGLELVKGSIKSFKLSIPWHKVIMGDNCVIKMEISNLNLEFTKSTIKNDHSDETTENKEKILEAYEEKIRSRRSSFNKILEALSTKFLNIEVVEFILSRLEIIINGIHVAIGGIESNLEFSISSLIVLPTDNNFDQFPDENTSIWNKIQGIGSLAISNPSVTLSDSLLQFKIITIEGVSIQLKSLTKDKMQDLNPFAKFKKNKFIDLNQMKVMTKEKILSLKFIKIYYSSKNYLWLGQSERDTEIDAKISISELDLWSNNEQFGKILEILDPKEKRQKRSAKEMWGKAREMVLNRVRMKSWLFITKKVLWRSVYKKLYAKYVLGIEPEVVKKPLAKENNEKPPSESDKNTTSINKYIQILIPEIEYQPTSKDTARQKPMSDIIPSFHFNCNCPVSKLEQALMADLERNLSTSEIIKYRQEEQDRYDFEQFEKSVKKSDILRGGLGKISNYFKTKGNIAIKRCADSKIVNIQIILSMEKINIRLKASKRLYLTIFIYQISLDEEWVFTEPIFRFRQTNYDWNSQTLIKIERIEIYDSLINDTKMIKPILNITGEIGIDIGMSLKHEYRSGFSVTASNKVTINIPDLYIFLVPNLAVGFQSFIKAFVPEISSLHTREDYLMDLLEPIQDFKINYKKESPLILTVNITKVEFYIACSYYNEDPAVKIVLGGVSMKSLSNKLTVDIKYMNFTAGKFGIFSEAAGLFMRSIFLTQGMKIINADSKTEVSLKTVQIDLSKEEFLSIFTVMNTWNKALAKEEAPEQIFKISLKAKWIEYTLQQVLSSLIVNVITVVINVSMKENMVQMIIKHIVYSQVGYFFETNSCLSAREVTVVHNDNGQTLLHLYSTETPITLSKIPTSNFLYRDPQAAFYIITQNIDKISKKYQNILCTTEFTFANFYVGIDLELMKWVFELKELLKEEQEGPPKHSVLVIQTKIIFHGNNYCVMFLNKQKPNYILTAESIIIVVDNYSNKSQTRVRMRNPELIDVSLESSIHSSILSPLQDDSFLDFNYISKISLKTSFAETLMEMRMNNTRITFLNRIILEFYDYIYNDFMGVFSSKQESQISDNNRQDSICLLFINSEMLIPRNSAIKDGFTLQFNCLQISNLKESPLQKTNNFKYEKDLEDKKSLNLKVDSPTLTKNQIQWRMQTRISEINRTIREKKIKNVSDIDPLAIKNIPSIEYDGLEVFYYDPDEHMPTEQSYKEPQNKQDSEISDEEENYLYYSDEDSDVNNEDSPKSLDKKSIGRELPILKNAESLPPLFKIMEPAFKYILNSPKEKIESLSSEKSDSENVLEEVKADYKIIFAGCRLVDYTGDPISVEEFELQFDIFNSQSPMRIFIANKKDAFKLKMYQDQYYIMMKSMQENFCELTNLSASNKIMEDKIWLEIEVVLADLHLYLYNATLAYVRDNNLLLNAIENYSSLCQIIIHKLGISVKMNENGSKAIEIASPNFKIFDDRFKSKFDFEDSPPLIYMYSDDPEYNYHCRSGIKSSIIDESSFKHQSKLSQPNAERIYNNLIISININSSKEILIDFSFAIFIIVPDFLSDLTHFFQSPFNPEIFTESENLVFIPDPNPPGMALIVNLEKIHFVFLSSHSEIDSIGLLLRFQTLSFDIAWGGDCNLGPGTMEVKTVIKLEGGHLIPVKYGFEFADSHYFDPVVEAYSLKINYMFHKPFKDANWVTSQVNIRSSKIEDFNLNLTFSGIATLKQVMNHLSMLSAEDNPYKCIATFERAVGKNNDKTEAENQLSVNLALYGASCKIFNDQMLPIIEANVREILSAYQQEKSINNCEANFIILMQVDYFNQKLMAWEPMIEEWGLEVQYSCTDGVSNINLSEYGNILQINISTALISTISDISPIIMNLTDSKSAQQVSLEPYQFENQTGLPIKILIKQNQWKDKIQEEMDEYGVFILRLEELNRKNTESDKRQRTMIYEKKTLDIEINPPDSSFRQRVFSHLKFRKVQNIGIDTPDTYFVDLGLSGERHDAGGQMKPMMKKQTHRKEHLGRISKRFLDEDEFIDHIERHGMEEISCLNFLKRKKKYQKRLAKGRIESNAEKEYHNKLSMIVDVQWKQELGQRLVILRSSISVINSIPTTLTIIFSKSDTIEDIVKDVVISPNGKISVPLLVACKGKINIRPSGLYEPSRVIRRGGDDIFSTNSLVLSGMDGIVDKDLLTRVEFTNKGEIELGFIALCCRSLSDQPWFYCALTVKKIANSNPVRRIEQVKTQANHQQKGLIGYKKKIPQAHVSDNEEEKYNDEEFHLEATSDETMLIITSIVSFTNALSKPCKFRAWTDNKRSDSEHSQEDNDLELPQGETDSELSQGETEHLYYLNFTKDEIKFKISIEGYSCSKPLVAQLLNIDKEQRYCIELNKEGVEDKKNLANSNLFLWVRCVEDENKCWRFTLHSPYWIINKTDLKLCYGEPRMFRKKKFSHQEEEVLKSEENKEPEVYDLNFQVEPKQKEIENLFASKIRKLSTRRTVRYSFEDMKKLSKILQGYNTRKEMALDTKAWKSISLFSYSRIISKLNVAVNLEDRMSKWSQNFSLTNSGTSGELSIEGLDGIQYDLGVTIEKGQGVFQLTNIITFRPLYILKNNFKRELLVKQIDVDKRKAWWSLKPNSEKPIYWYMSKSAKALSVAAGLGEGRETTKRWSGAFSVNELGEFIIRLPIDHIDGSQDEDQFLQVSVISSDPMIIIQFSESNHRIPYRLENYTDHEITYNQVLSTKSSMQPKKRILKPMFNNQPVTDKYAWDEENSPHVLCVNIGNASKNIDFDNFAKYSPIKIDEEKWIETVMKKKRKESKISLKMKKWVKPKLLVVTLAEKWLIIQDLKNPISLDFHCTKVIYISDKSFELRTCTKSIIFTGNNEEDALEWYEAIDQNIKHTGFSTQLYVNVSVELKGVTHVMKFENEDALKSEKHHSKCKMAKKEGEAIIDNESVHPLFHFHVEITDIGFSLVDQTPQERIYLYLHGLEVTFQKFENKNIGLHFSVTDLKIDNQQANSHIPVILNPYFNSKSNILQEKTIIFDIVAERLPELDNINWLRFMIAPLELKIDESIISNMIEYFTFIQKAFQITTDANETSSFEAPTHPILQNELQKFSTDFSTFLMLQLIQVPLISEQKDYTIEKRIYIHKLLLGPLEFCVTLDKDNVDTTRNKKTNFIQILADLGLALTSIESTELKLAGYKISNLLQPRSQFISSMINHYKSQGIRELYKIVGSVELLGNPFALINSLKAGVKEMFYDPAVALIESPNKFGESLLHGSVGLVRHTVHGLFKSVGTLTGGIGRFLTALTLDSKFQTKMRVLKNRRADNFGDKLKIGFKQLSYGFVQGITGLVTAPIEGIKQGGFPGLLKGIGKGIIGTVAKPTASIVGTVSDAFSGIGNIAKKKHNVRYTERSRYPRSFNSDRILRPYDETSSYGQFLLAKAKRAVTYEKILCLLEITYKKKIRVLIVSNISIYIIRRKDFHGIEIPKRYMENNPIIENHIIVINMNIKKEFGQDADLESFKSSHKKSLLNDLFVQFENYAKNSSQGTVQISLRGIGEDQREGELTLLLNSYKVIGTEVDAFNEV